MTDDPRLTIRIDFESGARLGPGKAELLEGIARHGSIRAAGVAMGMSYRRAWLLADEINRMFREPSVFTRHGGKSGGGAGLTPFGEQVLACWQRMEIATRAALKDDLDWLRDNASFDFTPLDKK